jgi:hypothetical protein
MSNVRTIELNEKTIKVLNELREQTKAPQQKLNEINSIFTNILTGVCLSENVDLQTEKLEFSEDLTKLFVTPNEKVDEQEEQPSETTSSKSKIRKLK